MKKEPQERKRMKRPKRDGTQPASSAVYIPAFCISYVGSLSLSLSLDNKGDQPIQLSGIDVILSAPQTSRGYDNISRLCAIAQRVFLFFRARSFHCFFVCCGWPYKEIRFSQATTVFFFLLLLLDRLARTLPIRLNSYHALLKTENSQPKDIAIISFLSSYYIYVSFSG